MGVFEDDVITLRRLLTLIAFTRYLLKFIIEDGVSVDALNSTIEEFSNIICR